MEHSAEKAAPTRVQRLYRLTVISWPTPDGRPFDRQPEEFGEQIADAFHNPSDDNPFPEWLDSCPIEEWLDDPGGSWEPPHRAFVRGHYFESAGLVVPILSRRHWQTRAAAEVKAKALRQWGCEVRIDASDPITWTCPIPPGSPTAAPEATA